MDSAGGSGAAEDAQVKTESKNPEFDAAQKKIDHQALKDNVKNARDKVRTAKSHLLGAERAEATAEKELAAFEKDDD